MTAHIAISEITQQLLKIIGYLTSLRIKGDN